MDNKVYVKSISGQVYALDSMPEYMAGFEIVHRQTFLDWCKANGYKPEEMNG